MKTGNVSHAALAIAGLIACVHGAAAQSGATPATVQATGEWQPADALAAQMRVLGGNPRNLEALIAAGDLSRQVGDLSAALALFARAEAVSPGNPRVLAGRAATLVQLERPGEALAMFQRAEASGLSMDPYRAMRGLAYDLTGQQGYAQRDYRRALELNRDDETLRRLALSLAISGDAREAQTLLDPLLRRSDRGAWRARALALAMNGDLAGAQRIATTMMPGGAALAGFFARLPSLSPADRAFAVHFGELKASPGRLADARLAPVVAPLPREPVLLTAAPVQLASAERPGRARRANGRVAPAVHPATVATAVSVPALPDPPAFADTPPSREAPTANSGITSIPGFVNAPPPFAAAAPVTASSTAERSGPSVSRASANPVPATIAPTRGEVSAGEVRSVGGIAASATATTQIAAGSRGSTIGQPASGLAPAAAPLQVPGAVARSTVPQQAAGAVTLPVASASIAGTTGSSTPSSAGSQAQAGAPSPATAAAAMPRTPAGFTAPPTAGSGAAAIPPPSDWARAPSAVPPLASASAASAPSGAAGALAPGTSATLAGVVPTPSAATGSTASAISTATPGAPSSPVVPGVQATPSQPAATASATLTALDAAREPSVTVEPGAPALTIEATPPAGSTPVIDPDPQPAGVVTTGAATSTATATPGATAPGAAAAPASAAAVRAPRRSLIDSVVAGIAVPASELVAPPPVRATTSRSVTVAAPARAGAMPVADQSALRKPDPRRAGAQVSDPKKPEPKKPEPRKPEPRKPDPVKADPARWWVQVAGGANAATLDREWRKVAAASPTLKGRKPYQTPLRATNRLLTGPFKTEAEARAVVNALAKEGRSAFTFQSNAGQKVDRVGEE